MLGCLPISAKFNVFSQMHESSYWDRLNLEVEYVFFIWLELFVQNIFKSTRVKDFEVIRLEFSKNEV